MPGIIGSRISSSRGQLARISAGRPEVSRPNRKASPARIALRRSAALPLVSTANTRAPPSVPRQASRLCVRMHPRHLVVVEPGPLHARIVQPEPERPHEVQRRAGIGAEPDDVAGVRRDFGLEEDDVEHRRGQSAFAGARGKGDRPLLIYAPWILLGPGPVTCRRLLRTEIRLADRAALRLRRLRRGVHAHRGILEPRRRRHRPQGHDASRGSATRRTASPRRPAA